MKQITEAQHLNTTFARACYAKPGEPQAKAIKRFMTARRREWTKDTTKYPAWNPKMTTRAYVRSFHALNMLIDGGHVEAAPDTMPTLFDGPEVTVSEAANDAQAHGLELAAA